MIKRCLCLVLFLVNTLALASICGHCGKNCPPACKIEYCCGGMGGVQYCDSSAGRYVCNNGYYSACYCTRHAVMDLQHVQGCCLWQGGVLTIDPAGLVICNNGGFSEVCSAVSPVESVAAW